MTEYKTEYKKTVSNLEFYMNTSSMKVTFAPSESTEGKGRKFLNKHGVFFIEMATGENKVYDWANKGVVCMAYNDFKFFFDAYEKFVRREKLEMKIVHDPGAGSDDKGKVIKTFAITNGAKEGSYLVNLSVKGGSSYSHYLQRGELYMLLETIKLSMPYLLGIE